MSASLDSITTAIVDLLVTIPEIKEVHDYPSSKYGGFPSVSVYIGEDPDQELLDSATNEMSYSIRVRIVDSMKDDPQATEARMRKLFDLIVDKINKSDDLNGLVHFLVPVKPRGGFAGAETDPLRVMEIDVIARCSLAIS